MPINDLTNTTWILNLSPVYDQTISLQFNFTSNGNNYTQFSYVETPFGNAITYDNTQVFLADSPSPAPTPEPVEYGWVSEAYRTITITSDVNSPYFIAWLEENATQVSVITDLTGCTWVGNNSISGSFAIKHITFISNGNNYSSIHLTEVELDYNSTVVGSFNKYGDFTWNNNAYKTIQITGGTDATNADLIAWLESNGTLTAPAPAATKKILKFNNKYLSKVNNSYLDTFNGVAVQCFDPGISTYTITCSVSNGTYSGSQTITTGGTASITVTANSGYALPSTISVSGADYTYNSSTGVIGLSNATGNVSISVVCEAQSSLLAPTISLYDSNSALKIESANDEEDEYEIYVDDTLIGTYNKFYDFEASGANLTKCLGKEYYTGEIITPTTVNGTAITGNSASDLFKGAVASKITLSEGFVNLGGVSIFEDASTVNISFPSTIADLDCFYNYHPPVALNIGLQGYIEYAWDTALPAQTARLFAIKESETVNFYVKSTILTLGDKSLYVSMDTNNTTLTMNLYFEQPSSAVMSLGTSLIYQGASKYTTVYNVYTDNASIKDAMLTYAGQYCTVNVYKRDGGSW